MMLRRWTHPPPSVNYYTPFLPLLCKVEKLKMEDEEETVEGVVNDDTTEIIIGPKMLGGKF